MSVPTETEDVVAIWRLQSRYADVISRRAWPELPEVLLPDAPIHLDTVTAPARTLVGPDELAAFVAPAMARFDHFTFVILNTVVERTSEDEAAGRIFMCELRHDAEADTWPNAHGLYQDRYRREGGRWWIAERHYRSLARQGPDGTVLGLPAGLGPLG